MLNLNTTISRESGITLSRQRWQGLAQNLVTRWIRSLFVAVLLVGIISIVAPTNSSAQEKEAAKAKVEKKVAQNAQAAEEGKATGEKVAEVVGQDQDDETEEDDDDMEVEEVVVGNPFGARSNKMMAAKKFQLKQTFAVELEVMKRVGDLDAKQMLKLKIAAKGAVKKITLKWKKSNRQMGMVVRAVGVGDEDDEEKEEEEIVFKDADEIDQTTLQMITMNNGNPFRANDPLESKFWKKTVASVLTEEQATKIKAFKSKRNEEKREALIISTMAALSYELALDDDQKKKLAELVIPVLRDRDFSAPLFYEPYVVYYYVSKVSNRNVKKILTPAQHQKWKMFLAPAKQVGQMMEMENDPVLDGIDNEFFLFVEMILSEVFGELERALSELFGW